MNGLRRPLLVGVLMGSVIALVASAAVAAAVIGEPAAEPSRSARVKPGSNGRLPGGRPAAPSLPGTVIKVALWDMGGPMLGPRKGMMDGRFMSLRPDRATAPNGIVSFLVSNGGSIKHEVVLLPDSHVVGTRPMGVDAKIDEAGSLGEASRTGGEGVGQGIAPGASGWLTITLAPGQYELVCNLPGHYTAGMHAPVTIT